MGALEDDLDANLRDQRQAMYNSHRLIDPATSWDYRECRDCHRRGGVDLSYHVCEGHDQCTCRHPAERHTVSQGCRDCICEGYTPRPRIVVLCGSTRFYDDFLMANYKETLAGHVVLSVGFFANATPEDFSIREHGELIGITALQKVMLDELHKRKIDLADEVLILNVGGYLGPSTRSEVEYATRLGKVIRYLEP